MKKVILASGVLALSLVWANAQTITLNSKDAGFLGAQTNVFLSDGVTLVPSGNYVGAAAFAGIDFAAINADGIVDPGELGALNAGYSEFSLDGAFSASGTTIGSAGDGTFAVSYGNAFTQGSAFENLDLYTVILVTADNSSVIAPDWSNVVELGVFSTGQTFGSLSLGTDAVNFFASAATADIGSVGSLVLAPVPEPSTFALLGGALALGFVMYRRRKA